MSSNLKKEDPRVTRTRNLILDAFKHLLNEKRIRRTYGSGSNVIGNSSSPAPLHTTPCFSKPKVKHHFV